MHHMGGEGHQDYIRMHSLQALQSFQAIAGRLVNEDHHNLWLHMLQEELQGCGSTQAGVKRMFAAVSNTVQCSALIHRYHMGCVSETQTQTSHLAAAGKHRSVSSRMQACMCSLGVGPRNASCFSNSWHVHRHSCVCCAWLACISALMHPPAGMLYAKALAIPAMRRLPRWIAMARVHPARSVPGT